MAFCPNKRAITLQLQPFFLKNTNNEISALSLPAVRPLDSYKRRVYVCEGPASRTLAQFRLANAGLGNRAPRLGTVEPRYAQCAHFPLKPLSRSQSSMCWWSVGGSPRPGIGWASHPSSTSVPWLVSPRMRLLSSSLRVVTPVVTG